MRRTGGIYLYSIKLKNCDNWRQGNLFIALIVIHLTGSGDCFCKHRTHLNELLYILLKIRRLQEVRVWIEMRGSAKDNEEVGPARN